MKFNNRYLYLGGAFILIVFAYILVIYNCPTTIILVRHAEKASQQSNTNLSSAGLTRAEEDLLLATMNSGISAVYATEYCRTSQTAMFVADHYNLPLNIVQNGQNGDQLLNCTPGISVTTNFLNSNIDDASEIVSNILNRFSRKVILVVGHSNTVPELIEALGAPSLCPDYFASGPGGSCHIPDSQFDNIFIISKPPFGGSASLTALKYGD